MEEAWSIVTVLHRKKVKSGRVMLSKLVMAVT